MGDERKRIFPFHYGGEAESYTFYRIPKILFTQEIFQGLSTDAKLLYGLLLDRMQLSLKNGWVDEEGKVFIYYTVDNIMKSLSCGNKKAGSLLAELDDKRGIGLVTRVRQGLGKPDRIYVHKCALPEMPEGQAQTCQNDMSGNVETTSLEMLKGHANNTEKNHTENSDTDPIISAARAGLADRMMEERQAYRDYFKERCLFEYLKNTYPYDAKVLDEMLEILVDICSSRRRTVRIAGDEKPIQVVKSQLMKLDNEHIQYVLECFKENTTKVRSIKQYLLTSLYNAPMTIDSYYTALAHHDMYGGNETQAEKR